MVEIFESPGVAAAALVAAATFVFQVYQNFLVNKAARAEALVRLHTAYMTDPAQVQLMEKLLLNPECRLSQKEEFVIFEVLWFYERLEYLLSAGAIRIDEMQLFKADLHALANHSAIQRLLDEPTSVGYFSGFRKLARIHFPANNSGPIA